MATAPCLSQQRRFACCSSVSRAGVPCSAPRSVTCAASVRSRARHSGEQLPRMAAATQQQAKYERILAFVESHATPLVGAAALQHAAASPATQQQQQPSPSSWHHSYDEEADEGCEPEPAPLPACASAAAAAAAALAEAGPAPAPAAAAPPSAVLVHSWSYGSEASPKPFFFSWDEEAEGSFELTGEVPPLLSSHEQRAQRRAAMHEARHAAKASRRVRRAALHPQLGDLEHMAAWVPPPQQQPAAAASAASAAGRSAGSARYAQLVAQLIAGADGPAARQYRKPAAWHLTFDEEAHGDAPDAVLGSC